MKPTCDLAPASPGTLRPNSFQGVQQTAAGGFVKRDPEAPDLTRNAPGCAIVTDYRQCFL